MELKDNLSDKDLIEIVITGDTRAFDMLIDRYRDKITQMMIRRTRNAAYSEDLIQETFVKAFLKIGQYNNEYTFGQWINAIAKNTFIDFTRRNKIEAFTKNDPADNNRMNRAQHASPNPEEKMINAQISVMLEKFMEKLPDNYRTMIVLRFYKDYSYEEIAKELSLPIGTVKTQIHRAREMLYKLIVNDKDSIF